jgi:peptidoglycan/xylan/chitin deacetylase (PgdA/CDA1 family)
MTTELKVPILMYHRVAPDRRDARYTVSPENFFRQMEFLHGQDYRVVDLDGLLDALDGKRSLPPRSMVLTFDDGFLDTVEYACPILKRFKYTAAFFLVSGLMGKSNEWMQRNGARGCALLGWSEARSLLSQGFTLGSHSVSHPKLPDIDPASARREIEESKRALEDRLAAPIRFFAYPHGLFNATVQEFARAAGYAAACSTRAGFNNLSVDRFALRRLDVFGTHSVKTFRRNLLFGENEMNAGRLLAYYARRAGSRLAAMLR